MNEGIEAYTKIINSAEASEAEKARAYYNRGLAKQVLGEHEEAILDYNEAIALNPNDAMAYDNRGNVKENLGKYEEAIVDYTEAIALNPDFAGAYHNRGNAKRALGKHEEAIVEFDKAIKRNPDHADTYLFRGLAKDDLGEYEEAIVDHDKAIALNPNDAYAYLFRGFAKKKLGKYEEAIDDYTEAIALNPAYATAYCFRGNVKGKLGKHEEAIKDYDKAIALDPGVYVYVNRASAQTALGKHEEAIADYTEAIKHKPDYAMAYNNRAGAYYNSGLDKLKLKNYKEAIDDLNRALQDGISDYDISDEDIQENEPDTKDNSVTQHVFSVFQSVANILNRLKIHKRTEQKVESEAEAQAEQEAEIQYLSHTTSLSVFIRHLFPIEHAEAQALKKFRLHHIAYANDPTEGTFLFDVLGITKEHTGIIPYVMVASFCGGEKPETLDRLPIWNLYGDGTKGISLIFRKDDLISDMQGHAMPSPKALPDMKLVYKDEKGDMSSTPNKGLVPMLYKVYYTNKENVDATDTEDIESINTYIQTIKESLKAIREKKEESQAIHTNTLRLLTGLSYLVKNESYQYENEYRLLYFATPEHIPNILKLEEPKNPKPEEQKTLERKEPNTKEQDDTPRVYMDTDILENLYCVMTAPKVSLPQVVEIQYRLDAYEKHLKHLETPKVKRSSIPYR